MLDKIEALRKQPKAVRNRYAFSIALSITLFIAVIWTISLPSRMSLNTIISTNSNSDEPSLTDQLSELKDIFGGSIEDIKSQAELIGLATSTAEGENTTNDVLLPEPGDVLMPEPGSASSTSSATVVGSEPAGLEPAIIATTSSELQ